MRNLYRLFRRGRIYYCEQVQTRHQESLHTANRQEAQRFLDAKNDAVRNPQ